MPPFALVHSPTSTGPENKRRITPSVEQQQSKLILAWFSSNNHPPDHRVGATISTESVLDPGQRLLLGKTATVVQIFSPPESPSHPSSPSPPPTPPLSPSSHRSPPPPDWTPALPPPSYLASLRGNGAAAPEASDCVREVWHCRHHTIARAPPNCSCDTDPGRCQDGFPDVKHCLHYSNACVMGFEHLPRTPWPLTVSGRTVHFWNTTDPDEGRAWLFPAVFPGIYEGLGPGQIDYERLDRWEPTVMTDAILRRRAKRIDKYFSEHFPVVKPLEVIFELLSNNVYVVLDDEVDLKQLQQELPQGMLYLHSADVGRSRPGGHYFPLAKRTVVDTTAYAQLRPGILLRTDIPIQGGSLICSSTAGVVVEDKEGVRGLTGAARRLCNLERIWQGDDENSYVGREVQVVDGTSLAVIKIEESEGDNAEHPPSTNQVFEAMSGVVPQLKRLRTSGDRLVHKGCYLNSPFMGNMEATVVGHSVQFRRHKSKPLRVVYDWLYTGQVEGNEHKVIPPDETMGAAVWDDEGVVLGFWDSYIPSGLFAGVANAVSASQLADEGFHLMTD